MSVPRLSLFEIILARLSLGAAPVDGAYWFQPRKTSGHTRQHSQQKPEADRSPASLNSSRRAPSKRAH